VDIIREFLRELTKPGCGNANNNGLTASAKCRHYSSDWWLSVYQFDVTLQVSLVRLVSQVRREVKE